MKPPEDETFQPPSTVMPIDGPLQKYDNYMDDVEKIDHLEVKALIADYPIYGIAGPLGNGACECDRKAIHYGTKEFG
jgi:hypothetical protein